jgi:DNA repair exonuclease SbcCD ATPase subunit
MSRQNAPAEPTTSAVAAMDDAALEALALEALFGEHEVGPSEKAPEQTPPDEVIAAIEANALLVKLLVDRVSASEVASQNVSPQVSSVSHQQLLNRIDELENQVADLQQQNSDLAAQLAHSNVCKAVTAPDSSRNDALSWEERKLLIFQQMEAETFDANAFTDSLAESANPSELVDQLRTELNRRNAELDDRNQQINELRHLLEQQAETRANGLAIGAAAIAQMLDDDELVREERERLQHLQVEWEEKFRQQEIELSLERARLSRDRQELSKKLKHLEFQLAEQEVVKAERKQKAEPAIGTRRWMAELGITE